MRRKGKFFFFTRISDCRGNSHNRHSRNKRNRVFSKGFVHGKDRADYRYFTDHLSVYTALYAKQKIYLVGRHGTARKNRAENILLESLIT